MTVIRNLPLAEYLASANVSHSKLRTFAEGGPQLYHDRYVTRTSEREETQALAFGQAFETLFQRGGEALARECCGRMGSIAALKMGASAGGGRGARASRTTRPDMIEWASARRARHGAGEARRVRRRSAHRRAYGLTVQSRPDYVL